MDFRNKYVLVTIRTLVGLFFIMSGVMGFMSTGDGLANIPEPQRPMTQMLLDTGIFQYIKVAEIIAGLLLVTGFLPALGALILAPICIGVVIVNLMIAPSYVITGIIVCIFDAYLGYAYWDKFKAIFVRTPRI